MFQRIVVFVILCFISIIFLPPVLAQGNAGGGFMPPPPPPPGHFAPGFIPPPPPPGPHHPGLTPPLAPRSQFPERQGPEISRPGSPPGSHWQPRQVLAPPRSTGDALLIRAMKLMEKAIKQLGKSERRQDRRVALSATRNLLAVAILLRDGRVDGALKRLETGSWKGRDARQARRPAGQRENKPARKQTKKQAGKKPAKVQGVQQRLVVARRKLAKIDGKLQWLEVERDRLHQEINRLQTERREKKAARKLQKQRDMVRKQALNRTKIKSLQMELAYLEETSRDRSEPAVQSKLREQIFHIRRKIFELEEAGNVLQREQAWQRADQQREDSQTRTRDRRHLENRLFSLEQEAIIQDRELERQLEILRERLRPEAGKQNPGN